MTKSQRPAWVWTQKRLDRVHVTALKEDAYHEAIRAYARAHQDMINAFLAECSLDVGYAVDMVHSARHIQEIRDRYERQKGEAK